MSGGDVRGGVSKREASQKLSKCFAFTPKADLGPLGHKMGSVLASGGLWSRKLSPSGTGALLILPAGGSGSVAGAAVYPVEVDETTFQLMERFAGLTPVLAGGSAGRRRCFLANCCASAWTLCSARPRRDVEFCVARHPQQRYPKRGTIGLGQAPSACGFARAKSSVTPALSLLGVAKVRETRANWRKNF